MLSVAGWEKRHIVNKVILLGVLVKQVKEEAEESAATNEDAEEFKGHPIGFCCFVWTFNNLYIYTYMNVLMYIYMHIYLSIQTQTYV